MVECPLPSAVLRSMPQKTLLITATDTEVGKTVLTTSLVAYRQTYYSSTTLGLLKLIQCGVGDRERYHQLFAASPTVEIGDSLYFETPIAPPIAAELENRWIDLAPIWQNLQALRQRHDLVLVEALGGLGSPVTHELTVADLAGEWRLETWLVAPVKLGAIAQIVANIALARERKVNLRGIVLSCPQPVSPEQIAQWTPIALIESLTQLPVLGILPHLEDLNNLAQLTAAAAGLRLEGVFPRLSWV
jgi:dethiobiotin synthetase